MNRFLLLVILSPFLVSAQTNIYFTNSVAADVFEGQYNPANYESSTAITDPHQIAAQLSNEINTDSLYSYLLQMSEFETRNTGSDTVSNTTGMGAARRWAHRWFERLSQEREDRLVVSYLHFEEDICGMPEHRNIMAVLPGMETQVAGGGQNGLVIIEGHLDSRCDDRCDVGCEAHGMEDNGSGSALVMELARVLSQYQFNRTIVFMLTTGEEQGLVGADALATYCDDRSIPIAAVLNNDVIGGITCGETSSPPSCPGLNDIDSTQVRMFSSGTFNSMNKQLVRYIKLQYHEELIQHVKVPMQLTVMTAEDRQGRGGDHIPFRQKGYAAMRFTSANEHGHGNPAEAGYEDRQHTSEDILGVDTDNNGSLDSFFVDFNYLARNAAINANAATMIAQGVCNDLGIEVTKEDWKSVEINIGGDWCAQGPFRIAVRTETNDWDTVLTSTENNFNYELEPGFVYFFSVARQNEDGVESLFSSEAFIDIVGVDEKDTKSGIELLQNRPNPFDEATAIAFIVHDMPSNPVGTIRIQDVNGRVIEEMPVEINRGPNEVIYNHGYGRRGTYVYSLIIDEQVIDSKKMLFVAN